MVSEKDRQHFANIAKACAEQEREWIIEDARRPPGEKMAEALRLSDELFAAFGYPEAKPIFSLPALWRARRGGK
jgi:hypothetical protein